MKTYGELQTAVSDWLNREDLTGEVPKFVQFAEAKLYRRLRVRENEFTLTLTNADDPFNPIPLPDNFKEFKLVTVNDIPCERISDQEYQTREKDNDQEWSLADVLYFATFERQLYLFPWPSATQTVEEWGDITVKVHYYGTESVSEMATWDTPTNPNTVPESGGTAPETAMRAHTATSRLLQIAYDAYLYTALEVAYHYIREPQKAAEYKLMSDEIINDLMFEGALAELAGSTRTVSSVYHD